jgi:hypothetical protein
MPGEPLRTFTIAALAALLCACSSTAVKDCKALAGPGWSVLPQPPANAPQLLEMENLPVLQEQIWLGKGSDRVMVCNYAHSLVIPGCGGSNGYEFLQKDGKWVTRGALVDFCDNNPDHGD